MRGQLTIILLMMITIHSYPSVSAVESCNVWAEGGMCYDSNASFSKNDTITWSIIEAVDVFIGNETRVQFDGSYLDEWEIKLIFNDVLDYEYLNEPWKTRSIQSFYNLTFDSADLTEPIPLNEHEILQHHRSLFYDRVLAGLSDVAFIDPNNPIATVDPPYFTIYPWLSDTLLPPFIHPTIFRNGSIQENYFEWAIQNFKIETFHYGITDTSVSFNHSIVNDRYQLTIERNFYNGDFIEYLKYSFNTNTGILEQFQNFHETRGSNGSLVIELNSILKQSSAKIRIGEFSISQILLVVTPILIIAIIIIIKRINSN